ncbi:18S rRNA (guanine-N(7))-methyltransferase RID2-like [Miscanthus floridulus]|uniref:18S rRNA (guanine-N(7))-methyltransferase RID2-like n=1 Tax=Miscanthus floridulus TaxID=154761 RepID=UPI003457CB2D
MARAGAPAALGTWSRPSVQAWLLRPPRRGRGARELQSRQSGKPPHTRRGVRMPRPEFQAPPDVFYNESEVPKYTTSSRIIEIQSRISERALELLALPNDGVPKLLLDIGCGSGLSGETLMEHGHHWIGYDISKSMLDVALLM